MGRRPSLRRSSPTSGNRAALLAGALLWLVASPAVAVDFEKLVMPGEVIQGHADVETECSRCHTPFRSETQNELCLECHEDVAADLGAATGFHGRSQDVADANCRNCHTEHKGRDADVVELDEAAFDHDLTDHPLHGAHRRVPCESCHEAGKRHREAPGTCIDCHQSDDVHQGRLGEDCASCHSEAAWGEARFDHAATRFPLVGRHQDVDCALCHPAERFENTATECQSCHRLADVHRGRFGERCDSCHSPRGWKRIHFDHGRDTRFPLEGRHRDTACEACHANGIVANELSMDCVSCHRADDVHGGRNGSRCEQCHGVSSWKAEQFDHDRMTDFPLRGAHRDAKCRRCHTGTLGEEKLEVACFACHREDDVHAGQEGEACGECHNEHGWTHRVFFEHDLTRFPLLGFHAVSACEECHATPRFQDAEIACAACHLADDPHLKRLGTTCARCHNPNGWTLTRFDHERDTGFALRGAHAGIECLECHRVPAASGEVALPATCHACHGGDDVHSGGFGRNCGRCHGDETWKGARVGN